MKNKNTEVIIQILILLEMAGFLIYALISKKATYYIHPRYFIGLWISAVFLLLFVVSLFSKLKKARHNVNIKPYLIFLIPLIAAVLFPAAGGSNKNMLIAESVNSVSGSGGSMTTTDDSETYYDDSSSQKDDSEELQQDYSAETEEPETTEGAASETEETEEQNAADKYEKYVEDGVLVVNDDIFADWYCDLYNNLDDFEGQKCQYLAQVYDMDGLEENQFLAGRYFMVCCAADLEGYGIICESDESSDLKDEEWITVTGTITDCQYEGEAVPMLKDVTITKAKAPEVEYVYYNNF